MEPRPGREEQADVERAMAGDAAAFERLYRAHVARVHTLARRLLGAGEADDATQEVFVRAWRYRGGFRGEGSFAGWLQRLARHTLLDQRARFRARARQRPASDESIDELPAAPTRDSDAALDFESAIERLPARARQVFVLHDVEGCTHEEITTLLAISAGTSKSQLHRARMLLRGRVER